MSERFRIDSSGELFTIPDERDRRIEELEAQLEKAKKGLAKYYKLYGFEMKRSKKAEAQLDAVAVVVERMVNDVIWSDDGVRLQAILKEKE